MAIVQHEYRLYAGTRGPVAIRAPHDEAACARALDVLRWRTRAGLPVGGTDRYAWCAATEGYACIAGFDGTRTAYADIVEDDREEAP